LRNRACLAAVLGLAAPAVMAQSTAPSTPPGTASPAMVGPVGAVTVTTLSGKVSAIDRARRLATEQGDDGRTISMFFGPNMSNFDNLKVGDQVAARYSEAVSLAIAKGGGSEIRTKIEADSGKAAPPGGKPGLSAVERTTIVANIVNIDRELGIPTLKGIDSTPVDIRVMDKQALAQFKPDDQVVIGYAHAAAILVAPARRVPPSRRRSAESKGAL